MARETQEQKLARELEDLRARLVAAQQEEEQRRSDLARLRADFHRLSEQLRRQRPGS